MPKKWWIGCSGFYYKHWRERFYPKGLPQRKWFEYYCEHFNTVELNVTFYRFPRLKDLQAWYERAPRDFRFTVKAPRLITHFKKFNSVEREINEFYDVVMEGLDDKLGAILFQLHPRFAYSEENLEKMINVLDPTFKNVIEFREAGWWNPDVTRTLKKHEVTFCGISYPDLPDIVAKTSSVVYYRFHGVPDLYRSSYSKTQLSAVSDAIKAYRGVKDAYVYFNNDIDVAAVTNAGHLQALIGQKANSSPQSAVRR
jgi:uncharacterized protein YecE (DUF72 family)